MKCLLILVLLLMMAMPAFSQTVIRYNQLGYTIQSPKVLVLGSKQQGFKLHHYKLVDATTGKTVLQKLQPTEKDYGAYGPFKHSYRIPISAIKTKGIYQLVVNDSIRSGIIRIGDNVYSGTADFCLRYMRQQRSGFNPYLKDSCHMYDGYSLYGAAAGLTDSTHIDAVGGWHDASDYLQYTTTTANATYHLMMAYRDFPHAFSDTKQSNGLEGKNGLADVMDEAKWGLDWLLKMHPQSNWMFNQLGDDRDHISMRIPKLDSQYGKGFERPVYFLNGAPQQRGKFMNNTTGTSSTAGKFTSAFALAHKLYNSDSTFRKYAPQGGYYNKAFSAYQFGIIKPGAAQTVSVKSPYIYAEDNWTDDMELAATSLHSMVNNNPGSGDNGYYLAQAVQYAKQEKITPWLGADTAKHYQWYPFINIGHYELAMQLKQSVKGPTREAGYPKDFVENFRKNKDTIIGYYKLGIEKVYAKAKQNAFYRGVPFIWCSNNLTTSFATQCMWYKQLSGDKQFEELEQANIDWLFGTNPWGTSMVYGLPAWGDTPVDPHSAFTHLKNYPIDGGLIDGPVYTSIFKGLIGLTLYQPDEYAEWQSDLAVYHDDYGDYSTNEPTMDGTASLIYLLSALEPKPSQTLPTGRAYVPASTLAYIAHATVSHGAIIRGDSTKKQLTLVFTGHEFAEGAAFILQTLKKEKVKAAFFLTGDFIRQFPTLVKQAVADGHYVGPHSNKHLLYASWQNRDSLLVTKAQFQQDLLDNYKALAPFGINLKNAPYFLPPYEWYNQRIADWCAEMGVILINLTPGTLSATDYTTLKDKNYRSNETIRQSIFIKSKATNGLNGFILLFHVGAGPLRKEKFFKMLPALIEDIRQQHYDFVPLADLF